MPRNRLVLLHGLLGSLTYFDPAIRLRDFDLLAPDMPGYGGPDAVPPKGLSLAGQADAVAAELRSAGGEPSWVLGHSVGGAIALLLADRAPELVKGVINVEGNFTLEDAFWTGKIAAQDPAGWGRDFAAMRADPAGWLRGAGIRPASKRVEWARAILDFQSAETIQAVAKAVIAETGAPGFLGTARRILDRGIPLVLVAGERSAAGWHPPDWARDRAAVNAVQSGAGHMMMLEDPDAFCGLIRDAVARAG